MTLTDIDNNIEQEQEWDREKVIQIVAVHKKTDERVIEREYIVPNKPKLPKVKTIRLLDTDYANSVLCSLGVNEWRVLLIFSHAMTDNHIIENCYGSPVYIYGEKFKDKSESACRQIIWRSCKELVVSGAIRHVSNNKCTYMVNPHVLCKDNLKNLLELMDDWKKLGDINHMV